MYIHLGQGTVVLQKDVIGIFDIETASTGKITRWFLSRPSRS
jgi:hypothetical protein